MRGHRAAFVAPRLQALMMPDQLRQPVNPSTCHRSREATTCRMSSKRAARKLASGATLSIAIVVSQATRRRAPGQFREHERRRSANSAQKRDVWSLRSDPKRFRAGLPATGLPKCSEALPGRSRLGRFGTLLGRGRFGTLRITSDRTLVLLRLISVLLKT